MDSFFKLEECGSAESCFFLVSIRIRDYAVPPDGKEGGEAALVGERERERASNRQEEGFCDTAGDRAKTYWGGGGGGKERGELMQQQQRRRRRRRRRRHRCLPPSSFLPFFHSPLLACCCCLGRVVLVCCAT